MKMSEKSIILNKIILWGAMILAFLTPLFFLPFTYDLYEFNKNMLLIVSTFILLVLWLLKMALARKITFKKTPLDLPVLILAGVFILSSVFNAPNKWETLWTPLGTGTIISLAIYYFIITNNIKKELINSFLKALAVSGSLLSLLAIYQFISIKITPTLSSFLTSLNPTGSLVALATFLAVVSTLGGLQIYKEYFVSRVARNEGFKSRIKNSPSLIFHSLTFLICFIGLGLSVWQLSTVSRPLFLPYSISWAIAVETFKNWRLFLLGIGPTSFLDAFAQFRPSSYNLGNLWGLRFTLSSNYYFHLLTTVGILGLAAFAWIIFKTLKSQIKEANLSLISPLFLIFFIFLFLFPNLLLLFVLFLLLGLLFAEKENLPVYEENSPTAPWVLFLMVILFTLGSFYLVGRAYAGEIYFKKSLTALQQNDGNKTYAYQIKALTLNPYNDVYRLAYSQTNFALAFSLAQKTDISDQDRQNITVLVQQAIKEAKMAVTLNKNKVTNWENLAGIYRQLLNFAQGADQWAITALSQAIKLDPNNPNLKLNLGGIYYALNNYDEAIRFFQQAIDVKPDFANGYYNLSAAYREKGDFQKAHEAMQITLNLVPSNSEDYNKARTELDDLAKKIPVKEATQAAEAKPQPEERPEAPLIEPQPYPSPVITPPIELPEEQAAPDISPAPQVTP